ncbi:MAG: cyclic nucleotide-binding domain-containing protein [Actinobacteria bacterium]|nr:cyclic nucleotide-binding domain-containing protein [Actinomycetota bacterium]
MDTPHEKLRSIPLFAGLDDDALALIASRVTEFEAGAGHVLVERGQEGAGMFVLEEGSVIVELPGGRTVEQGPGEFFGELALLGGGPRAARVRAATPVRCLAIGRTDFAALLHEEPRIAVAMLPVLARRLAESATH